MKKLLAALVVTLGLAGLSFAPPVYGQASKQAACEGVAAAGESGCGSDTAQIDNVIKTAVNILSIIVGIAAVIMIIVGGMKYVTSSGDANNLTSARNTILYAIIGVVIVALAQIIVRFVLSRTVSSS